MGTLGSVQWVPSTVALLIPIDNILNPSACRPHTPGIAVPHLQAERPWRLRPQSAALPAEAEAAAPPEEHLGAGESR